MCIFSIFYLFADVAFFLASAHQFALTCIQNEMTEVSSIKEDVHLFTGHDQTGTAVSGDGTESVAVATMSEKVASK